jgi:hypothetical protein
MNANFELSLADEYITRVQQKLADFRKLSPGFDPIYHRYFGTNEPAATIDSAPPATNR